MQEGALDLFLENLRRKLNPLSEYDREPPTGYLSPIGRARKQVTPASLP